MSIAYFYLVQIILYIEPPGGNNYSRSDKSIITLGCHQGQCGITALGLGLRLDC